MTINKEGSLLFYPIASKCLSTREEKLRLKLTGEEINVEGSAIAEDRTGRSAESLDGGFQVFLGHLTEKKQIIKKIHLISYQPTLLTFILKRRSFQFLTINVMSWTKNKNNALYFYYMKRAFRIKKTSKKILFFLSFSKCIYCCSSFIKL